MKKEPLVNDMGRWANESLYLEFTYTAIEIPKYKEQCCSLWFEDKRIKSAVEWLKKNLNKFMDEDGMILCGVVREHIDQAFPNLNTQN